MKKKRTYILITSLILVLMIILGVSYALLQKNIVGNSNKVIYQVGDLEVKLDDTGSKDISITGAAPTEDSDGLKNNPYTFSLVNNAVTDLKYTIYLEDDADAKNKCGSDCELIPYSFIRYNLSNDSNSLKTGNLSSSSTELYTGTIESKTTDKFNLRVWLSIDADNNAMGKYYFGKLKVVLSQGDDYCIRNGFTKLSDCILVMNNHESNVETAKRNIVAKGTPDFSKTATTDEGLFMAEDDDGPSYYYRGAVKNNYVSFAGFMWRIIRQNGDGSIRMIYAGKKTNDTGDDTMINNSPYNIKLLDPTYVGYKYNEDFSIYQDNNTIAYYKFTNTKKYDFATSYTFNESTKKFTLTGDIQQLTWKDNHDEIAAKQLYTCLDSECNMLYRVKEYNSDIAIMVQPISYSSKNLSSATENVANSKIKEIIDNWYKTNLIDYSNKLSDETFCSDRSISSGTGYRIDSSTYYGAYNRLHDNKTPSFKCSQTNDKFKVENTQAKLDYPISLITADEVSFAGGRSYINAISSPNNNYYLYNEKYFWTLSPSEFDYSDSGPRVWIVEPSGSLHPWCHVTNSIGIRPVINLRSDVQTTKGDGTPISPYQIKL